MATADERSIIHNRLAWLKRAVVIASISSFIAAWGLVAEHIVGVTSQAHATSSTARSQPPQNPGAQGQNPFFGGNSGSPFGGTGASGFGKASGPVLGSGGS